MLGLAGAGTWMIAGIDASVAGGAGTTTPTTTPGPAPNQSQINSTKAEVDGIEATLSQEEVQTNLLDGRYDTAMENLQNAQSALQTINASIVQTKAAVDVDKRRLSNDAVKAYIYGTPQTQFASLFTSSAILGDARSQYTKQIVGDLNLARASLQTTESHLSTQKSQQETEASQAQYEASEAKSLAQQNAAEAAATQRTLDSVQGQLTSEVAAAAVQEAQEEAEQAAKAATAAQAQKAAEAAAAAAAVADSVGGSSSGAAATTAANQAASSSASASGTSGSGPVGGTGSGDAQGMAAVQAAISQLGVPYSFGGEDPGRGFDCSGLVQWAWGRAGVTIPRTTESQWPDLPHVPLSALEPGDLLFYYNLDGDDAVDHVVMYVGSGPYGTQTIIQAPFTGTDVSYSPIYTEGLIGAGRP